MPWRAEVFQRTGRYSILELAKIHHFHTVFFCIFIVVYVLDLELDWFLALSTKVETLYMLCSFSIPMALRFTCNLTELTILFQYRIKDDGMHVK